MFRLRQGCGKGYCTFCNKDLYSGMKCFSSCGQIECFSRLSSAVPRKNKRDEERGREFKRERERGRQRKWGKKYEEKEKEMGKQRE
jgi:hypothetical protein